MGRVMKDTKWWFPRDTPVLRRYEVYDILTPMRGSRFAEQVLYDISEGNESIQVMLQGPVRPVPVERDVIMDQEVSKPRKLRKFLREVFWD